MTLDRFTLLWTSADYPPQAVADADLRRVEQRLGVDLPRDYREAVLRAGLPRPSAALLSAIVEHDLDLHDVADFHAPAEIVEETIVWRGIGMPGHLVAFASDSSGNKFCFDAERLKRAGAEGGAIFFYDHDFGSVDRIAPGFDAWIEAFCAVEPVPGADLC